MRLRELTSHADLLEATHDSAFIRYDIPSALEGTGYALGDAVALPRRTRTRGVGMLLMGSADEVGRLVGTMRAHGVFPVGLQRVTVQRGALDAVAAHLPVTEGNDWEWLYADRPPSVVPAESRLVRLTEADHGAVQELFELGNPHTDARPFGSPAQHWVGARDGAGRLVACGVREPNIAGWPMLFGITVHPRERGTGLGLAVTAHLTREAVRERGVCTLGMYSHNELARRVYHGLGYGGDHLWSSRRLAPPGPVGC